MAATRFLGASIVSYSATLGWGGQQSNLNVTLVEDPANGDLFSPPEVGAPVYFQFEGQRFGGILQNWRKSSDSGGNPLYDVSVVDPREVLNGVQLILSGYSGGTYGMPNIINIYGYLESFGFGFSQAQTTGIPWVNIIAALNQMVAAGYGGAFGNTITLKGYNYELDLSQIPLIPSYYRIGGDSISLMDFINEICEAGACDYFFTLERYNGIDFITLHTVSRAAQITQFGKISQFVNSVNAVSKDSGFEFINATTGKFVVGGSVIDIWYNYAQAGLSEQYQGVWPYWGLDFNGNAVIGIDNGDDHLMTLDARQVNVFGISSYYKTSIGELRAALDGQSSWEFYLQEQDNVQGNHYQKATKLGIIVNINGLTDILQSQQGQQQNVPPKVKPAKLAALKKKNIEAASNALVYDELREENVKRVYEYVRAFAQEYLGRRFMVRIPFLYTKVEDSGQVLTSQYPVDAGYIPESLFYSAYGQNLIPLDINSMLTDDGRIVAYCRFDNAQNYDFSELDPESLIPGDVNGGVFSMFVKCTVYPEPVYLDRQTGFSPRAIIELPGCVKEKTAAFNENIKLLYDGILGSAAQTAYANTYTQFGVDNFYAGMSPKPILPNICAVPLESRILTYGPWFAAGASGKMEFEKDESLVPWNFGDLSAMDFAGQAKVISALGNNQLQEFGQVEFAGSPQLNLGDILVQGGPYVTDVTVNISQSGITTVYTMNSWSGNYFKILRQQVDRNSQLSKNAQQMRRNFREAMKSRRSGRNGKYYSNREWAFTTPRRVNHSSHAMICGELIEEDQDVFSANVVLQPYYNTICQMGANYTGKAAMSIDGLFRPFSTDTDTTKLPHFEEPESGAEEPTVDELNPFGENTDINVCTTGNRLPDSLLLEDIQLSANTIYRGMALRGPLVISGWGYDIDGKPVPNESLDDPDAEPTDNFYANYKKRPDLWKTGPVDMRWDDDRKVWVASGGTKIVIGKTINSINKGTSGTVEIYEYNDTPGVEEEEYIGKDIESYALFDDVDEDKFVAVMRGAKGQNYIISWEC